MKLYQISHLKIFMKHLLLSECFDHFLLKEGVITTSNTFHIDGLIQKNFYTKEELESESLCLHDYSFWKDIRPLCLSLIKGKRTPLFFKFVLLLSPAHTKTILEQADYGNYADLVRFFTLAIKYDGTTATLTTGISTASFLPDHTPEQLWDEAFLSFLNRNQLEAEVLG